MSSFFRSDRRASTAESAEAGLRELYGDLSLGGLGGYRESVVGDAAFAIAEVELYGSFDARVDVDAFTFAFSTPGCAWRVGRDEGDLSAAPAVFQPDETMRNRITGPTRVVTLNLARTALGEFAEALYAEPVHLRFQGQAAVGPALGRRFQRLVEVVRSNPALDADLVRATAYHELAVAALESFRIEGDRAERTIRAEAGLRAYRLAGRFIEDHLSSPITVADVAAAAGVGVADLHSAFRAHSPMGRDVTEHLRRGRLAAAHRDLVGADPAAGDTVAAIALRWGFSHPGRFAALHRSVYGVVPRHVLDR